MFNEQELQQLYKKLESSESGVRAYAANDLVEAVRKGEAIISFEKKILCLLILGKYEIIMKLGDKAKPILTDALTKTHGIANQATVLLGAMGDHNPMIIVSLIEMVVAGSERLIDRSLRPTTHFVDKDTRTTAMRVLIKIGQPAVPKIIKAIKRGMVIAGKVEHRHNVTELYLSYFEHKELSKVLGRIGISQAQLDELVELSRNAENWFQRIVIRQILGNLRDPRLTDYFVADSLDPQTLRPNVYGGHHILIATLNALGAIGNEKSIARLVEFFDRDTTEWSETVANILLESDSPHVTTETKVLCLLILRKNQEVLNMSDGAVEGCIAALECKYYTIRRSAAETLGVMGDKKALKPLTRALEDSHGEVCVAAINALGKIGSRKAVRKLIKLLKKSKYKHIKLRVVKTLGKIGDKRAVKPLIKRINSKKIGIEVMGALGAIGDKRAIAPLSGQLANSDVKCRRAAVEALGRIGGNETIDALVMAANDGDNTVRESAIKSLVALASDHVVGQTVDAFIYGRLSYDHCKYTLLRICSEVGLFALHSKMRDSVENLSPFTDKKRIRQDLRGMYLNIVRRSRLDKQGLPDGILTRRKPKPSGGGSRGLFRARRVVSV